MCLDSISGNKNMKMFCHSSCRWSLIGTRIGGIASYKPPGAPLNPSINRAKTTKKQTKTKWKWIIFACCESACRMKWRKQEVLQELLYETSLNIYFVIRDNTTCSHYTQHQLNPNNLIYVHFSTNYSVFARFLRWGGSCSNGLYSEWGGSYTLSIFFSCGLIFIPCIIAIAFCIAWGFIICLIISGSLSMARSCGFYSVIYLSMGLLWMIWFMTCGSCIICCC